MINRREVLLGMSAAALSSAAPSASALAEVFVSGLPLYQDRATDSKPENSTNAAADELLRQDLAGMANRADSEEGVPVLLACVNLVKDASTNIVPPIKLTSMNKAVTADFCSTAAAWERIKPSAKEGDVGNLIQVLAVRNFAGSAKGAKK